MVSLIAPTLILMTALSCEIRADEEGPSEKIIIHVPYKIHNHLHTHTNYKIIKVPENSIEKFEEPTKNEEKMKYLDKEIETILSGTKLPNIIKQTETQLQPQKFPILHADVSPVPMHAYHELKQVEQFHPTQEESAPQHLISPPTRLPTVAPTYHTNIPDNKYSDGKLYYHAFSTKPVPFYNPPVSPTYQVVEETAPNQENNPHHMIAQETHDRIPHHIIPNDSLERAPKHIVSQENFVKAKLLPKSGKEMFFRQFTQRTPFSTRLGKVIPTAKPSNPVLTTKLYSFPTISTKTFVIPTAKSFTGSSTKKPKAIIKKNNEEYEHIGYLVVGENSQKFVTVNPKQN